MNTISGAVAQSENGWQLRFDCGPDSEEGKFLRACVAKVFSLDEQTNDNAQSIVFGLAEATPVEEQLTEFELLTIAQRNVPKLSEVYSSSTERWTVSNAAVFFRKNDYILVPSEITFTADPPTVSDLFEFVLNLSNFKHVRSRAGETKQSIDAWLKSNPKKDSEQFANWARRRLIAIAVSSMLSVSLVGLALASFSIILVNWYMAIPEYRIGSFASRNGMTILSATFSGVVGLVGLPALFGSVRKFVLRFAASCVVEVFMIAAASLFVGSVVAFLNSSLWQNRFGYRVAVSGPCCEMVAVDGSSRVFSAGVHVFSMRGLSIARYDKSKVSVQLMPLSLLCNDVREVDEYEACVVPVPTDAGVDDVIVRDAAFDSGIDAHVRPDAAADIISSDRRRPSTPKPPGYGGDRPDSAGSGHVELTATDPRKLGALLRR